MPLYTSVLLVCSNSSSLCECILPHCYYA